MKPGTRDVQRNKHTTKPSEARAMRKAGRPAPQHKQQQKMHRSFWQRWGWGIAALVTALIVVAIVWAVNAQPQPQSPGAISGVVTYSNLSRDHVTGSVTYPQNPPVGGSHSAVWQNCGIYNNPLQNEHAVHDLEHGAVWITYQPALSASAVEQLRNLVHGHDHALLSPYPGLPTPVVISAWGVQLQVKSASDPRLAQFLKKYEQGPQTPELGAPCSGGLGTPDEQ